MAPREVIPIDKNWHFKQVNKDGAEYLPVSQFPTNIHLDLLHHGLIPDPYIGLNEQEVQWVGEAAWRYRTEFETPEIKAGKAVLAFDGLDTFAEVVLNGNVILETENMFIPERVDVTSHLKEKGINELVITFESAFLKGWERIEKHPEHKWGSWNGDDSRLAVRKAQYHWGWDWGPTLLTCGPWKPINLEIYESRIADLYASTTVHESFKSAEVVLHASTEGKASRVRFDIALRGTFVASNTAAIQDGHVATTFHIQKPELWYPIRYGKQPLYTVTATLLDGDDEADVLSKRIGIRKLELVQQPLQDQPGTSFFFRVNGIPVFCGGSNWIPADNFIPSITKNRYQDWIKLMVDCNQNMLRIWGGGLYENEALLDACDENGVLLWIDFPFACGNYPCYPEMLKTIEREARENVKLLRHHPSIAIFAGNNEDYQFQEDEGLTRDDADKDPNSWLKSDFPARYIYEKLLPDICKELVPDTYYHYGSPWGGKTTRDPTIGDIHQWNVWHGTQEKYQDFDKLIGRFVSEFGLEAFPSIKTIEAFLPEGKDDPDRYPQSTIVDFHNKATGHERRMALYLAENIQYDTSPFEQYIYCTQLVQAECLSFAYRLWRRQWKGPGREYCSGALVWQLNDCWPVTSWALCDYYLRPKHAYFAVKRELAPITVGIKRTEHRCPRQKHTRADIDVKVEIEVWASNLTLEDLAVECVVKGWDVESGTQLFSNPVPSPPRLLANQSTEILKMEIPVKNRNDGQENRTIIAAYLSQEGKQIARYVDWPQPLKHIHLQQPKHLTVKVAEDGHSVSLGAEVPVKGIALECEDEAVKFDDNLVDLVPGEVVTVGVTGAVKSTAITARYLGMKK